MKYYCKLYDNWYYAVYFSSRVKPLELLSMSTHAWDNFPLWWKWNCFLYFFRSGITNDQLRVCSRRFSEYIFNKAYTVVFDLFIFFQMSQRMAARVGYQLLSELDLTTFRIDGQIAIPDPDWPVIKWMAIRHL